MDADEELGSVSEGGGFSYWLVIVDDSKPPPPDLRQFDTLEELVECMRLTIKEQPKAWLLPLFGQALKTAEGLADSSLRFLVNSDGLQIPLFEVQQETKVNSPGFYSPAGIDHVDQDDVDLPTQQSGLMFGSNQNSGPSGHQSGHQSDGESGDDSSDLEDNYQPGSSF